MEILTPSDCLENQFIPLNEYGDYDYDAKYYEVCVEGERFEHKLVGRCVSINQFTYSRARVRVSYSSQSMEVDLSASPCFSIDYNADMTKHSSILDFHENLIPVFKTLGQEASVLIYLIYDWLGG